jgi:uncharacterized protein (TIGR03437 family)
MGVINPARLLLLAAACGVAWGQGPAFTAAGIVNASDYTRGPFAPNSVLSIFGSNLSWSARGIAAEDISGGFLPTSLNGVQVFVSGWAAPLYYVSPYQVNFVMPANRIPGRATVRVVRQGTTSTEVEVTLVDVAPALFVSPLAPEFVIAQLSDFSLIDPAAPARPGDAVILYATGLGRTQPYLSRPDEIPAFPGEIQRKEDLRVYLNGVPLDPGRISYAGFTPKSAGLYQINLTLPDQVPADPEIRVAIGEQISAPGLKLPLR